MLDFPVHQASGLQGIAPPQGAQLVAMVCHGEDRSDLLMLWKLCSAYLEMGYAMTVLDATVHESPADPGLAQLLEGGYWPAGQNHPQAAWQMLPAALGLQDLYARRSGTAPAWQQLGMLFADDAIVLVYGKPETLAALLRGSCIKPLLAVSSSKNALLTNYLALKRLLVDGRLEPTIVNVSAHKPDGEKSSQSPATASLMECAREFLGYQVHVIDLASGQRAAAGEYDFRPLASRLLESSLALGGRMSRAPMTASHQEQAFSGNH